MPTRRLTSSSRSRLELNEGGMARYVQLHFGGGSLGFPGGCAFGPIVRDRKGVLRLQTVQ